MRLPGVIVLFAITALASAFLLFWVEPLFARLVLPLLGGSPAVWNTCLMYFQAALLAITFLALPVAVPAGWTPPTTGSPIGWLLLLLTVAVGAPFLMLSATAPLLQRWLAGMDHPAAANPYLLYAASLCITGTSARGQAQAW